MSYVGELGWGLYAPVEYGLALWGTLREAGAAARRDRRGGGACGSLRLAKGYRLRGQAIHTEYITTDDTPGAGNRR